MSMKIGVKQILDTFKTKDGVKFYKLCWEETWIPECHLTNCEDLIHQYWKTNYKDEENSAVDVENTAVTPEDAAPIVAEYYSCHICQKDIPKGERTLHQKSHLVNKTSNEAIKILREISDSLQDGYMFLSPKETETNVCRTKFLPNSKMVNNAINEEMIDDVFIKSNVDGSVIYVCEKCHEEFSSLSLFRLHYHLHRPDLAGSKHYCKVCNKNFTSYNSLEKHSRLHEREKRHFYKVLCTKYSEQLQKARKKKRIKIMSQQKHFRLVDMKKNLFSSSSPPPHAAPATAEESKSTEINKQATVPEPATSMTINIIQPAGAPFTQIINAPLSVQEQFNKGATIALQQNNRNRANKEPEFSPEVLMSARQYIKAVSQRRKEHTLKRILSSSDFAVKSSTRPEKHSISGIGVDVELKKSEESLPIISNENGRYSYSCKICGKSFYNKFHHREHFNVHSGEMPYECEFCSKRFAQRSGWNRHIKLHHKYEVFQGPIPHSHHEKVKTTLKRQEVVVVQEPSAGQTSALPLKTATTSPNVAAIPVEQIVNRFVPIAPYPPPVSSIPVAPTILSPDRFPVGTAGQPLNGVVLHPIAMVSATEVGQPNPEDAALPKIVSVTGGNASTAAISETVPVKDVIFQCKKVRSMEGRNIFMVRIAPNAAPNIDEKDRKMDFAYVLDNCGDVKSKIFVNEQTTDDWVDFPLESSANDVLLHRLRYFGDKSRPGPKPKPRYGLLMDMDVNTYTAGNSALQKAFGEFQRRYDEIKERKCVNEEASILSFSTTGSDAPSIKTVPEDTTTSSNEAMSILVNDENSQKQRRQQQQQQQKPNIKESYVRKSSTGKEKRFSCSTCGRKFLAQAHLNDHMLIHTGEFPYKCMFCSRPFRHKSGLNSHHKRHIQNGIFDRPISSYRARTVHKDTPTAPGDNNTSDVNKPQNSQNEKSKRKSRTPQHVEPRDTTMETDILLHIKEEIDDDDDIDIGAMDENSTEQVNFDTRDIFECNFCGMNFPLRTAYLKHVNTVHKAPTLLPRHSPLDDTSTLAPSTGTNLDSDYIGIDDFSETLMGCDSVEGSPGNNALHEECNDDVNRDVNHGEFNLLDIKIKEEVIDE